MPRQRSYAPRVLAQQARTIASLIDRDTWFIEQAALATNLPEGLRRAINVNTREMRRHANRLRRLAVLVAAKPPKISWE